MYTHRYSSSNPSREVPCQQRPLLLWCACCRTHLRNLVAVAGPVADDDRSPCFPAAAAAVSPYECCSESHCTVTSRAQHRLRHTNVSTAQSGHSGLRRPSLCRYARAMYVNISLERASGGRREREHCTADKQRAVVVTSCHVPFCPEI